MKLTQYLVGGTCLEQTCKMPISIRDYYGPRFKGLYNDVLDGKYKSWWDVLRVWCLS